MSDKKGMYRWCCDNLQKLRLQKQQVKEEHKGTWYYQITHDPIFVKCKAFATCMSFEGPEQPLSQVEQDLFYTHGWSFQPDMQHRVYTPVIINNKLTNKRIQIYTLCCIDHSKH